MTTPTAQPGPSDPGLPEPVELTLFVSGASDLSAKAVAAARRLCEEHLGGAGEVAVVDVHLDPDALEGTGVMALPALVRVRPLPVRSVVGDLSEVDRVVQALDLPRTARRASGDG